MFWNFRSRGTVGSVRTQRLREISLLLLGNYTVGWSVGLLSLRQEDVHVRGCFLAALFRMWLIDRSLQLHRLKNSENCRGSNLCSSLLLWFI